MAEITRGDQQNLNEGQTSQDSALPYGEGLGTQEPWDEVDSIPEMGLADLSESDSNQNEKESLKGIALINNLRRPKPPKERCKSTAARSRQSIEMLLEKLGFSNREIAEAIGMATATVTKDNVDRKVREAARGEQPTAFARQLERFAILKKRQLDTAALEESLKRRIETNAWDQRHGLQVEPVKLPMFAPLVPEEEKLLEFLEEKLQISSHRAFVEGFTARLEQEHNLRAGKPEYEPYVALLEAVFGRGTYQSPQPASDFLATYITEIALGDRPTPADAKSFSLDLLKTLQFQSHTTIGPAPLNREAVEQITIAINQVVGQLESRESQQRHKQMITRRFGLDGSAPATFELIGIELGGISRERVRQMEAMILRKLHHPNHKIKRFMEPADQQILDAEASTAYYKKQLAQKEIERLRGIILES